MNQDFKQALLRLFKENNEMLLDSWLEFFDDSEKDEQHRYYADFLGFFEECLIGNLDTKSAEADAMVNFMKRLSTIIGEEKFFYFKDSVYTCYLKFPIFKAMDSADMFHYENAKSITAFFESLTSRIIYETLERKNQTQKAAIEELGEREAPISEIWDDVMLISIVGTLDSSRVLKIIDKILERLENKHCRYVIIDIAAIYDMNSEVANQLMKLNNAIHFMGSSAYLSGITRNISKSLTHLNISLGEVKTFHSVKLAMEHITSQK